MIDGDVRRQDLEERARELLASLGNSKMSETAYDTAWVARVPGSADPSEPRYPSAYSWLLTHQNADGSWGSEVPFAHDRVISTLAALVTLSSGSYRHAESELAVRRGVIYLNRGRPNLRSDPSETVGFELVLPELARQAKELGLRLPYDDWGFVDSIREDKLRRIPPVAVYGGPTSLTHSLEYLGPRLATTLVERCQAPNGSFGGSPSATAFVLLHMPSEAAARYVDQLMASSPGGGVADVHPINVFELAWCLQSLSSLRGEVPEYEDAVRTLSGHWTPQGVSFTDSGMVPDADDTAMALVVLRASGSSLGTEVLELFEGQEFFFCFPFERNQSVRANAGVAEALRAYESTPDRRRMILKALGYLRRSRIGGRYWLDKWHVSPYYSTSQVISAISGLDNTLVREAIDWILDGQRNDGSWGESDGTAEETAYAMDALLRVGTNDASVRALTLPAVQRGYSYLTYHVDDDEFPRLWLGKGLYCPYNVVRAAVLGVMIRYHDAFGLPRHDG